MYTKILSAKQMISVLSLLLITALLSLTGGCETDDLGKCVIKKSGDDDVYEEISIEECQNIFGDTVGASGWSWDPQD